MKEYKYRSRKTCTSCQFLEGNEKCTNPKVKHIIDHNNECEFWVVDRKNYYGNGLRMRDEGMNSIEAEAFLNRRDPAPSPVMNSGKRNTKLKIFRGPQ